MMMMMMLLMNEESLSTATPARPGWLDDERDTMCCELQFKLEPLRGVVEANMVRIQFAEQLLIYSFNINECKDQDKKKGL